ncbi:nuclear transport factor 2 family protein [Neorhizobium galegae]|uniref:Nuclear transport factor 2 family protein n=1 Tax=Neorhizobium galegae TaxID=399 RepID=A0A6A1TLR3_NEOGA|nr:nuclear transport factor 2 family protein [Neorhizobium galegae]KAB1085359.1 nuclear transport factor 2 family protein [Neorhizobium galegae]
MRDIEAALRLVEDQLEIQQLAARFSDAANERDVVAFEAVWASQGAVWEIGDPLPARAEGRQQIVELNKQLMKIERYFMQLTHSGVITLDGDRATARFNIREHGRGENSFYDNLAVYNDVLVREPQGWRFLQRSYSYRFLDQGPFGGVAFEVLTPRS